MEKKRQRKAALYDLDFSQLNIASDSGNLPPEPPKEKLKKKKKSTRRSINKSTNKYSGKKKLHVSKLINNGIERSLI